MMKLKRCFLIGIVLLLSLGVSAGHSTEIEVVTTIPVETTLKPEGTANSAETWVKMIASAKKSLEFCHFYFSTLDNEPLAPVLDAIIAAATRGVKVRILVGKARKGSSMETRTNEVKIIFAGKPNIKIVDFDWYPLTKGINHSKYFIVDHHQVFVGSQNLDWRSLKHIHETGLRIKDKTIAVNLLHIFEADWLYNRGDKEAYDKLKKEKPSQQAAKNYIVSSPAAYNPPGIQAALPVLIKLIDSAQKKITIQLLNYHVDIYKSKEKFLDIDNALRRAAKRGVSVKMLVADWNKSKPGVFGLQDLVKVKNIDVKFATIPQYSKGFIPYARVIHSKVMRVDDSVSWVGTSNWGKRYFYGSRNIEVITHQPAVAQILDKLFEALWSSQYTYMVDAKKEYKRPRRN